MNFLLRIAKWANAHDEWRGDFNGRVTMYTKHLWQRNGRKADLHTMIAHDAPGCFHTHPASAIRIILWGGYTEELLDGTTKRWRPGMVGIVRPQLAHRISALTKGRSYSLWLRGRKTHAITLPGSGWAVSKEDTA